MDDVAQKLAVLERQVEALWLMLDKMADVLFTTTVRGDAMQQLLTEHGLLGPAAVTARMAQMQDSAATETELDQSPPAKAWRALRRAGDALPE
jgi:hypothetical protein